MTHVIAHASAMATLLIRDTEATRSAEHYRLGEARLTCLLVLAVHLLGGLGQSRDGFVEVHSVPGRDLVAGDRISGPRFDRSECAPLDARHLDVTGDRVARHAEVML